MAEYRLVEIGGLRTAYLEEGKGDPVVLLHGFASSAAVNWRSTGWVDLLVDAGRMVIAPDLRGHGDSAKFYSPGDYRTATMAGDVSALCSALGVRRADVIGYSMGARIAASLALGEPALVRSLVMAGIGETLIAGNPGADAIAASLETPAHSVGLGPSSTFRRFAERTGSDLRALAACMRGQRDAFDPETLAKLKLPVLVASGSQDLVAGPPEPVAWRIPGAQALSIPGRDHMLAVGDRSFKRAVLDFLQRRP